MTEIAKSPPVGLPGWVSLVRTDLSEYEKNVIQSPVLDGQEFAYRFLKDRAEREEVEVSYVVAMDAANHILGAWESFRGTPITVLANGREVFRPAVALGAIAIVHAHNHPSGSAEPSLEDLAVFMNLGAIGATLDIKLLDCLVIGHESYTSIQKYLIEHPMKLMELMKVKMGGTLRGLGDSPYPQTILDKLMGRIKI